MPPPSWPAIGNQLLLAGFRRADGYAGLVPHRPPRLHRSECPARGRRRLTGPNEGKDGYDPPNAGSPVADPLPPVRLVTRAIVDRGGPSPLPAEAAEPDAATRSTEPLDLTPGTPGTISELDQRAGRLSLTTQAAGRQLLVVATSYHSGWQATVDGKPVPVVRVNRDFLGCMVEPGKHHVTLDFHPFSLALGRAGSTLGLGLLCAQWVVAAWLGLPIGASRAPIGQAASLETTVGGRHDCCGLDRPATRHTCPPAFARATWQRASLRAVTDRAVHNLEIP